MTTTEDEQIVAEDEDPNNFAGVVLAAVMARQHTRAALAHKRGLEDPCTSPSERRDMEHMWASHLRLARDFAEQLDQATDKYIATLERRDSSSK